ncbi:acyltransferase [Bradyrhizobium sp. LVM 105]|uniref:acyltransferase family protein n=1 Tax=Bradyrhizobium sp. LVM 105 TaxID=2341115 RepID=UPI000F80FF13|nr:acyltransferase [Bradyrhizobium sp. LVM 105]RTE91545.1 acyltransferase [Bradyrhizobium sp. LVM 105]
MFNLNPAKNGTSMALDALRALAAQAVCIGHGISFFMPQLRGGALPLPQNVGVLLFFVLSGFLISYTLVERSSRDSQYGFSHFFIDRLARIYSGLVPCLLAIAAIDALTLHFIGDATLAASYNFKAFVSNIFMIETYRGPLEHFSFLRAPTFGSGSQLWTLVIEWHIYLFVAALFFLGARPQAALLLIPVALFFGQIPIHYIFGALQNDGLGQSLFLLWLGGAYVYFLARRGWLPPRRVSLAIAVASAAAYFMIMRPYAEYQPRTYPLLVLFLYGIVGATQATKPSSSAAIVQTVRFFAGYSFTLYLLHHTIMYPAFLLWKDGGWIVFGCTVVLANVLAAVLASVTEMRHKQLASYLFSVQEKFAVTPLGNPRSRK